MEELEQCQMEIKKLRRTIKEKEDSLGIAHAALEFILGKWYVESNENIPDWEESNLGEKWNYWVKLGEKKSPKTPAQNNLNVTHCDRSET